MLMGWSGSIWLKIWVLPNPIRLTLATTLGWGKGVLVTGCMQLGFSTKVGYYQYLGLDLLEDLPRVCRKELLLSFCKLCLSLPRYRKKMYFRIVSSGKISTN